MKTDKNFTKMHKNQKINPAAGSEASSKLEPMPGNSMWLKFEQDLNMKILEHACMPHFCNFFTLTHILRVEHFTPKRCVNLGQKTIKAKNHILCEIGHLM